MKNSLEPRQRSLAAVIPGGARFWLVVLVFVLAFAGCAKIPDKLITPTLSIEPLVREGREVFMLSLSAGIQNENSGIAFLDMKGNVVFTDPAASRARVMAVPFEIPVILPFETGIIEIEKSYSEEEIMPLVTLLGSDKEKLVHEKILERAFIEKDRIGLELAGYQKKNIVDLLKDKVYEKN